MIEMRMRDENEINLRQVMNLEAGLLQPLDHFHPLRPIRIDEQIDFVRLDQERGVANPGDADLARANFGKVRLRMKSGALDEKRRDENARQVNCVCASPSADANSPAWSVCSPRRSRDAWRTTFLRLFLEKGIGTCAEPYKLRRAKQIFAANQNPSDEAK